jgi:hypothetical protein
MKWLPRIKVFLQFSLFVILFLFIILRILLVFSYSNDIGGIENNVVYSITKYLSDGCLYNDPESGNFNITQYSPVYYNLVTFICFVFKINPLTDVHLVYVIGRFLSLIFCGIGGVFLFKIFRDKFKIDFFTSFLLIVIYSFLLTRIHFSTRPDGLFSLLSILILHFFLKKNSLDFDHFFGFLKKNLILITLIFLAVLTKQSGIQYLFLYSFYFLIRKEYLNSILALIFFVLMTAVILFLFYIFNGEFFFKNIVGGVNNGFSFVRIVQVFQHLYSENSILLLVLFCSFIYVLVNNMSRQYFLICTNVIVLVGFALITSGKEGSWINYYNEFLINGLILLAIVLKDLEGYIKRMNIDLLFASFMILFQFPLSLFHKVYDEHYKHLTSNKSEYLNGIKVAQFLTNNLTKKDYFISFDTRIDAMLPLKTLIPNKDIVPSQSKFNYDKFNQKCKSNLIKYIVLENEVKQSSFMGINYRDYKKIDNRFGYTILMNMKSK